MKSVWRSVALSLALSAMLLRALLPAGWMPAPGEGTGLVICTGHGPMQMAAGHSRGHTSPAQSGQICPYTATAHLYRTPLPILVSAPVAQIVQARSVRYMRFVRATGGYAPQSPRGPPSPALIG